MAADSELSVKNGAELLDRLLKDIVAEKAVTHLETKANTEDGADDDEVATFSLARFMPLLTERITAVNPFTRMFLVSWIVLLESIPDLELVTYIGSFLEGLFKFLADPNSDVRNATDNCLNIILQEVKRIEESKERENDGTASEGGLDDRDDIFIVVDYKEVMSILVPLLDSPDEEIQDRSFSLGNRIHRNIQKQRVASCSRARQICGPCHVY